MIIVAALLLAPWISHADETIDVAWLPGKTASATAVKAVKRLSGDAGLNAVRFHLLPSVDIDQRHLRTLAEADVAVIFNMGEARANAIAPAVGRLAERGGRAYAVGAKYGEAERRAGLVQDEDLRAYAQEGGVENLVAMMRRLLARDFDRTLDYRDVQPFPESGYWNVRERRAYANFAAYAESWRASHPETTDHPWIGLLFNRGTAVNGRSELLEAIVSSLERRGFNVLPVFGYPGHAAAEDFFLDENGESRVEAVVSRVLKFGNVPETTIPIMERVGAPVINTISLRTQNRKEWEASPLGLPLTERAWQIGTPELAGAIAPTVIAARERRVDPATDLAYETEIPIAERIGRLADRIQRWVALRHKPESDKRVALIYYNYPPGKENIGASYLNVLPRSLWQMITRLEREGYDVSGRPETPDALLHDVQDHGGNIATSTPGALERLARSGEAVLLPVSRYRTWFQRLPEPLREAMIDTWGPPEAAKHMLWRDGDGKAWFVLPARRYGNLLLAPQPARGWHGDVDKMYHDTSLPPHHQYLAFYLWLQHDYHADAMVHVGTHATHEWLSGKEVGFTAADPSEVMVGAVPQIYPYIMDDIGEALQAKRRGMAAIISHMTPPFDRAHLNRDLSRLRGLIDDYLVAASKSESAAEARLVEINDLGEKLGVFADLDRPPLADRDDVEAVEHYLKRLAESRAPYGLHTFGVAPDEKHRRATAEAILSARDDAKTASESAIAELDRRMRDSAQAELESLVSALDGRYVTAGPGNDPLRNPDALPTGRDLYGFDPTRMPTPGTWKQGRTLARDFITEHRKKHGEYPDKVVFNLWSVEAMRHEGVTEAEILALLGVRPTWNEWGRVTGVEVIPREELGRPRVDVTMVPSGLYRDTMPELMRRLDEAVAAVKDLDEDDNPIREHTRALRTTLIEHGVDENMADRMAAVRLFGEPTGSYGTGVDPVVQASNTWEDEGKVADVFLDRTGHLFGQGFWGERPGGRELAVDLFRMNLRNADAVVHSRSSHLYGTLDNDDTYQYLGATSMAVREVSDREPDTLILNLAESDGGQHESLAAFMGREMRTRYTNPEWVDAMLDEGYAGTRFVNQVTRNLWGWQVTVPEAVDDAKWQEMYETYVADREDLNIRERFREADNLLAYQALVDKMLVAINKGYWNADEDVKAHLEQVNREVIEEAGVACDANSCSSEEITHLAEAQDREAMEEARRQPAPDPATNPPSSPDSPAATTAQPAPTADPPGQSTPPGASRSSADQAKGEMIEGKRVEKQTGKTSNAVPPSLPWTPLLLAGLVLAGFLLSGRRAAFRP